jgi:hypothetical protein
VNDAVEISMDARLRAVLRAAFGAPLELVGIGIREPDRVLLEYVVVA